MKRLNYLLTLAICFFLTSAGFSQSQIILEHDGGYIAKFLIVYDVFGSTKQWGAEGKHVAAGYEETVTLPAGAINIKINAKVMTLPWPAETWVDICTINAGRSGGKLSIGGGSLHTTKTWTPKDGVSGAGGAGAVDRIAMDQLLPGGNTQLHNAIRAKNNIQAQQLLDNGTTHINTKNSRGFSPLHEAVQNSSDGGIDMLLSAGANMYTEDNQGLTPFALAVKSNKLDIVKKFAAKGYNVSSTTKEADLAVKSRNTEMVKIFLDNQYNATDICLKAMSANNIELARVALDDYGAPATIELFKKAVDSRKFDFAGDLLTRNLDANQAMDYAIQKSATKLVNTAMENGGDPQKALKYAVEKRDMVMATNAISINGADPNPVLEHCIKNRQVDMVSMMLTSGGDANKALTYAINNKNDQIIDVAIGSGAQVNDSHVQSVAKVGNNTLLQKLITAGGKPEAGLQAAMGAGKYQTAELLIQAGATPDGIVKVAVEKKQKNLLMAALDAQADPMPGLNPAITGNMTDYATLLFNAGATTNDAVLVKSTITNNNIEMLKLMLDNGTEADLGMSESVSAGKEAFVKMLIEKNANATKPEFIAKAAGSKNLAITNLLLGANADANHGMVPAVKANASEIVKVLLTANADPNPGMMPAVQGNYSDIVKLLLTKNADGSSSDLIVASVSHNNPSLTQQLITAGGDPSACLTPALVGSDKVLDLIANEGVDVSSSAYLHKAVSSNLPNIAAVLIRHGNDPMHMDASNNTYLHIAAPGGSGQMVSTLTAAGIDVNAKNSSQNTALHMVVSRGKTAIDIVNALIAAGADVNATNDSGVRPLNLAKSGKVKKSLKKAGAAKSK